MEKMIEAFFRSSTFWDIAGWIVDLCEILGKIFYNFLLFPTHLLFDFTVHAAVQSRSEDVKLTFKEMLNSYYHFEKKVCPLPL